MKIVIAGYGPVGKACEEALRKGRMEVMVDDPYKDEAYTVHDTKDVDGVVVCVATPENEDGSCVTQERHRCAEQVWQATKFLIKSAVDPVWSRETITKTSVVV